MRIWADDDDVMAFPPPVGGGCSSKPTTDPIEALKGRLPIWQRERFAEGGESKRACA